jgi:methanogenic corrinoid protein MtbC1
VRTDATTLGEDGLRRYEALKRDAVDAVTERFYSVHGAAYARFGDRGRQACREDLACHLEFLRPVLEFGLIEPMVDYLRWLASVLAARGVPAQHLSLSLDWLAEFFAARMEAPGAQVVAQALRDAKANLLQPEEAVATSEQDLPAPWAEAEEFELALLAGDRLGAGRSVNDCFERGCSLVEIELHIIQPALYGIGRKWQDNKVTVAQEHLATAIAQAIMMQGLYRSQIQPANGSRILLACVADNHHSVGLQMVADAFHLAGWDVQFLGANVPTNALLQHVEQSKPNLLGLSISFAQQLRAVKEVVARLNAAPGSHRPPIIVGGLAVNQFSPLAGQLGADAWSPNAAAAITSAARYAA